jgi:hypothetical protein
MNRGRWLLPVVAALAVGIAIRASFLLWSPLPATLDGFRYARLAEAVLAAGDGFAADVESDELVTTWLLAVASAVTDVGPLRLAQPLVACVGGASVLAGLVLVRGLGRAFGLPDRRVRTAAVLAALTLAVEGLYLRRSGVPDEEAFALLLLPLFALAAHRLFVTRRPARGVAFVALAGTYPPLHNLSSVAAALTLTALAVLHVHGAPSRRSVVLAGGATLGFWAYFFGYYAVAERVGLELTYSGLIREHPGTFLAWIVLLAVGTGWLASTSRRSQRASLALGFGVLFLVAGANLVRPVFPGTLRTPPLVLGPVLLFVVPVALAAWGLPETFRQGGDGPAVIALVVGPLTLVWFTLSTSLTPRFFSAAMRAQSFAHFGVVALAAVVAVGASRRRPAVGRSLVLALALVAALSAPLGFVHLDTGTAPRTVHGSEFGATSVAGSGGSYASDHRLARLWGLYYGEDRGEIGPTRAWLAGGPPPGCPTVALEEWTHSGAHFYPAAPLRLSSDRYRSWQRRGHLVYSADGYTEVVIVAPVGGDGC